MPLTAVLLTTAMAADIIWLGPDDPAQQAVVTALPGAGALREAWDLRAAGTLVGPADDAAYARLASTLQDVREFELKLDGELVIMDDLAVALEPVTLVRGSDDRAALFRALAYQGFAVSRYYEGILETDPAAERWRRSFAGETVEAPWQDAAALEPAREITPYDISETPQRLRFGEVQARVAQALPGGLRVLGVPDGAQVYVDGRPEAATDTILRVPPGTHYVHVDADGRVLDRWVVRLEPGQSKELELTLTDAVWQGFVRGVSADSAVPEAIAERLEAFGGEVWIARAGAKIPEVFAVTADGLRPIEVPRPQGSGEGGLSVALSAGAGWLSSGDFYLADFQAAPPTRATVNSASIVAGVDLAYDIGLFRAGAGVDCAYTPGEFHVARYGENTTRLRPFPHVSAGVRYAVATLGFTFPHHPTVGARVTVPIARGLEVRGDARLGTGGQRPVPSGPPYTIQPLYTAFVSVGYRIRP